MRKACIEVDVNDKITPEELLQVIGGYDAMVVRSRTKVRKPVIDAATNLKVVVRGGVGVDNIDVDYAQAKGIKILNTPGASTHAVAELTIAYLFALARPIVQATASLRDGLWEKAKFEGIELAGKVLGIIGMGRIGSAVAQPRRGPGHAGAGLRQPHGRHRPVYAHGGAGRAARQVRLPLAAHPADRIVASHDQRRVYQQDEAGRADRRLRPRRRDR